MTHTTYGEVLARNIRAARSRAALGQELVAARMRALGYTEWRYQTVGSVERGKRRVTAEEIMALAWALQANIFVLMKPAEDDGPVEFPGGGSISAHSVGTSLSGANDHSVAWREEEPVFSPAGWPQATGS